MTYLWIKENVDGDEDWMEVNTLEKFEEVVRDWEVRRIAEYHNGDIVLIPRKWEADW